MAETVGQHQVSTFASPVNPDPLNADVVRGNDNTLRAEYVTHDADPGIHVQSSAIGSRPAAGSAGRKWLTTDTVGGVKYATLWYDDGASWIRSTTFIVANGQPTVYDAGNSGTSITINWNNGPVQKLTLTGNCTVSFSNPLSGGTYTLILVQDGTGGRTVTLTGWTFGDNAPTYNTGASKKNVVVSLYDGSAYLAGFSVKGA